MLISHLNMTDFVFSSPLKSLYSEFASREFQFLKSQSPCATFNGTHDNLGDTLTKITREVRWWVGGWCPNSLLYWARNVVLC